MVGVLCRHYDLSRLTADKDIFFYLISSCGKYKQNIGYSGRRGLGSRDCVDQVFGFCFVLWNKISKQTMVIKLRICWHLQSYSETKVHDCCLHSLSKAYAQVRGPLVVHTV